MSQPHTTIGDQKAALEGRRIKFLHDPEQREAFSVHEYLEPLRDGDGPRLRADDERGNVHEFTVRDDMKIEFVDDVEPGAQS